MRAAISNLLSARETSVSRGDQNHNTRRQPNWTRIRLLLQIFLLLTAPVTANAQFTFTTNSVALTITGYTGSNSIITLPASTNGFPVTSIGDYAFSGKSGLSSVTIPDNVTSIGAWAFWSCAGLTNFTIGSGVTNIGMSAFTACSNLTGITIPAGVTTLGGGAFMGCQNLAAISVAPESAAFSSVDGVLFDKSQANLLVHPAALGTDYAIPAGVTNLGYVAFWGCNGLTNVTLPASVSMVTFGALANGPTAITVPADHPFFSATDGVLFDKNQTTLVQYLRSPRTNYAIPGTVTRLMKCAFWACSNLTSVTIPDSVTNIGSAAFDGCAQLVSAPIPASVTSIGNGAFVYCYSLAGATIPAGVTTLGTAVFESCYRLTTITIPGTVASIGDSAFQGCYGLTNVIIADGVATIGASAFGSCYGLTSLTIPRSITNIGTAAFQSCDNLRRVFWLGNAPSVGPGAFHFSQQAVVYYVPGTTGWGPTFASVPAVLWNPVIQAGGPAFGLHAGQFGFTITGTTNIPIVLEASTDPAAPVWTPLKSVSLTNGSLPFSEPWQPATPARFYRIRSP